MFDVPAESTPWGDPGWRESAPAWAREHVGCTVLGIDEPRLRAWSITMRLRTSRGPVWFKANPPGSRFEAALTRALSEWAPGRVLTPLAIDAARGWSLLPDGGPVLGETHDLDEWVELLRQYAVLQRATAAHVPEMLAIGVPDLRADQLLAQFDELVAVARVAMPGSARPKLLDWCARLAASPVPATIDHSDLHEGQIFAGADGRFVFFDWGDASVAHPFTSLLVALRVVADRIGADCDLDRARDAYLEPWTAEHPAAELRATADVAVRLGTIARAHSWWRLFPQADEARTGNAPFVAQWLLRLFEPDLVRSGAPG
jgi:hypothetical protein